MDIKKLEYFEAVSRLGSFTRAAEELMIAQPSITAGIRRLEEELGLNLFVRNSRRVLLTAEGEQLSKRIGPILQGLKAAEEEMRALKQNRDKILNIGAPPVMGSIILPVIYKEFKAAYPEITPHVMEMGSLGITKAIDGGEEIELGFVVLENLPNHAYRCRKLFDDEVHVIVSETSPLAAYDRISIRQLDGQPIIFFPDHSILSRKIREEFQNCGMRMNILMTPSQVVNAFSLVRNDIGISFVLGGRLPFVDDMKGVRAIPLENPIPFSAGWIWRTDISLSYAARRCIQYTEQFFQNYTKF